MLRILGNPFGLITNRLEFRSGRLDFSHSDRNLFLGIIAGLLVLGYGSNLVTYFRSAVLLPSDEFPWSSFLLAVVSTVVFSGVFLRIVFFSKRLTINEETLVVYDHWPLPVPSSKFKTKDIEKICITTLFTHLSKKSTIYVSIRGNGNTSSKHIYSSPRNEMNDLVTELRNAIQEVGVDVDVHNENAI